MKQLLVALVILVGLSIAIMHHSPATVNDVHQLIERGL